jgi:hypothetical protein
VRRDVYVGYLRAVGRCGSRKLFSSGVKQQLRQQLDCLRLLLATQP